MSKISIEGNKVVDLSYTLEPGIPCFPGFPDPKIEFFMTHEKGNLFNVETVTFCPHTGTHLDAPWHFIKNAAKLDELPCDCLIGPAVVIDLTNKEGDVPITAEDVINWEKQTGESIRENDAVLIFSGHDKHWKLGKDGDDFWKNGWPYMTKDLAEYFLSKKIRLIGMEPMAIDKNGTPDFPAHDVLLSNGILIIENLTNMDKIGATRCHLIATPLRIKGGTGVPIRALAIV